MTPPAGIRWAAATAAAATAAAAGAAVIIPARRGSRRFPAKMLASICGKPLIVHTLRRSQAAGCVRRVIVATDDDEIAHVVRDAGGEAVMTSVHCASGTERVAEASRQLSPEISVVINVQGDEPLVDPVHIDRMASYLLNTATHSQETELVTLATPLTSREEFLSPNVVKTVAGTHPASGVLGSGRLRRALYFSRAPIPFASTGDAKWFAADAVQDDAAKGKGAQAGACRSPLRHVGIYGFRRAFLDTLHTLSASWLQEAEDLEQLRWLEAGHVISLLIVDAAAPDVNEPKDLGRVERFLQKERDGQETV